MINPEHPFYKKTLYEVVNKIDSVIEKSPEINEYLDYLNSLGIVVEIQFDCNIFLHMQPGFKPPSDFSELTNDQVDKLVPDSEYEKHFGKH